MKGQTLQEWAGASRIFAHMGPARISGDDIFGIMVNYTKRVESTDNHHGIRLSDVVRNQIKDENAQRHVGLRFDELKLALKGFQERQTIWNVTVPVNPFVDRLLRSKSRMSPIVRVPEEPKKIRHRDAWAVPPNPDTAE